MVINILRFNECLFWDSVHSGIQYLPASVFSCHAEVYLSAHVFRYAYIACIGIPYSFCLQICRGLRFSPCLQICIHCMHRYPLKILSTDMQRSTFQLTSTDMQRSTFQTMSSDMHTLHAYIA